MTITEQKHISITCQDKIFANKQTPEAAAAAVALRSFISSSFFFFCDMQKRIIFAELATSLMGYCA